MWHHHAYFTPTSPKAILLHSSLLGAIKLWVTLYLYHEKSVDKRQFDDACGYACMQTRAKKPKYIMLDIWGSRTNFYTLQPPFRLDKRPKYSCTQRWRHFTVVLLCCDHCCTKFFCKHSFTALSVGGPPQRIWARQGPIFYHKFFWPVVSYRRVLKPRQGPNLVCLACRGDPVLQPLIATESAVKECLQKTFAFILKSQIFQRSIP